MFVTIFYPKHPLHGTRILTLKEAEELYGPWWFKDFIRIHKTNPAKWYFPVFQLNKQRLELTVEY